MRPQSARELARSRRASNSDPRFEDFYRLTLSHLRGEITDKNFVFSLSSRRDDLTQWRAYANEGRGFTIGFDTRALLSHGRASEDEYGFSKVIYSSAKQDRFLRDAFKQFEKIVSEFDAKGNELTDLLSDAAYQLAWTAASYSVLFKHSSFQAEREWRINSYAVEARAKEVKVRVSGDRLVPYMAFTLCSEEENCLPVTCIGVGPGFKNSSIQFAVEKLCEQTGFEVDIYNADTPFRRL